jgi:serine/threonine protein kinase
LNSEAGTVQYAAPELYQDAGPCTNKVDVFAFGLMLYEIVVGSPVFDPREPPFPIMRRLLAGEMPSVPDRYGIVMQQLIPRCWSMNPDSRPSFSDILEEFRQNDLALIPGADSDVVREYVIGVRAWEDRLVQLSP